MLTPTPDFPRRKFLARRCGLGQGDAPVIDISSEPPPDISSSAPGMAPGSDLPLWTTDVASTPGGVSISPIASTGGFLYSANPTSPTSQDAGRLPVPNRAKFPLADDSLGVAGGTEPPKQHRYSCLSGPS